MEDKITLDPTTPRELQEEIDHTKTETGAMSMVQEEWEKGIRKLQPYHRQWFLNTAYLLGFQHLVWHPSKNRLWLPPSRRKQVRMTSNLMMSAYRINLSKLSGFDTLVSVLPNSNEQEDVDAARLAQKVWFHIKNDIKWRSLKRRLLGWVLSCGNGFLSVEWNPNAGQMLSQVQEEEVEQIKVNEEGDRVLDQFGNPVMEMRTNVIGVEQFRTGKISMKALSPFSVVPIGSGTELNECDSVIVGEWLSLEEIRRQFPDKGKYVTPEFRDTASTFEKFLDGLVSPTTSQVNPQSGGVPSEKGAVVKRYWQKSTPEFPDGRLIICANNVMLFMGDNPTPKNRDGDNPLPIVHYREIDVPFRLFGRSSIEDQIPDQKAYNKALSIILEHHSLFKGKWVVPRGAHLKESNLDSSADEVVEAIPIAGQMPHMINIHPPTPTLFSVLEKHKENMMEQSGVREVSRGALPAGARSGVAIQLLQESDNTQIGTTGIDVRERDAEIANLALLIASERMVVPQKIQIIGKNNEVDVVDNFTGDMLRGNTQVIAAGSNVPFSLVAKKAEILDMEQRGAFINPETGRTDWRTVMELLEFGQTQDVFSEQALDEAQAETENRQIMSGIMPIAKRYQDQELHVKIHNRRRKAPEYIEMIKQQPQIDQLYDQHLQQHGAFLTEQIQAANAQAMAQMGGQKQSGAATQEEVQSDQFATPDEGIQQGGPM
jgi:hypothetical protein